MRHLFQSWTIFAADLREASHIVLLSDYDGTLTPIVRRPEEAVLSPGVRQKLQALAEEPAFSVGIISGRSLSDVKALVAIEGIYYAGNHGLEIEGPGLKFIHPAAEEALPEIKGLVRQLSAELANIDGVFVEDKGLSLSVHFRLVKGGDEEEVARVFHRVTSPRVQEGKVRVTTGKKVWEVRPPVDWHKGKAVETVTGEIEALRGQKGRALTIYLGDDRTDEDAFRVLHRPGDWGILVGREDPSSNADYFLDSFSEVETFFSRLLKPE